MPVPYVRLNGIRSTRGPIHGIPPTTQGTLAPLVAGSHRRYVFTLDLLCMRLFQYSL